MLAASDGLLTCCWQDMTHRMYASSTVPQFIAKFYLYGEAKQVGDHTAPWLRLGLLNEVVSGGARRHGVEQQDVSQEPCARQGRCLNS